MHRRPLGNGRRLAILGAIALIVGWLPFFPWYTLGGNGELTPIVLHGADATGIVAMVAALATLALVTLPYATESPVTFDRGLSFVILAVAALIGVGLFPLVAGTFEAPEGLLPDRAYGFWIAAAGAIVLARGAYEVVLEPPRR
jgi:hypothetical protein